MIGHNESTRTKDEKIDKLQEDLAKKIKEVDELDIKFGSA